MREVCFFTTYDERAKEMGQGMANSVKKFYPDIPMEVTVIGTKDKGGHFDLMNFCYSYLKKGLELLDQYQRIIHIDPDSVMCNLCPDLFGDYELGVVKNNVPCGPEYGGMAKDVYVNAGLTVCTSKEVWRDRINEFSKRNNTRWETLNEQNALNYIYHTTSHKTKLLEFDDRTYGISSLDFYKDMFLRDNELYLPNNKKVCVFHAAGVYWKTNNKINFDFIENEEARERIISYTL